MDEESLHWLLDRGFTVSFKRDKNNMYSCESKNKDLKYSCGSANCDTIYSALAIVHSCSYDRVIGDCWDEPIYGHRG